MSSIVKFENVTKIFPGSIRENDVYAINNVSFEINDEKFVGIIGESGSGKSTMLNLVGGLIRPTNGNIFISGENLSNMPERESALFRNKTIGYIFQKPFMEIDLSAVENVEIPMIIYGKDKQLRREKAQELLNNLGLSDKINAKTKNLSGGQLQRVSIARALANDPQIILADEPTGCLDSKNREVVMNILFELSKKGITVILVTHNLEEVKYCNRVIELEDGQIIKDEVR